MSNPYRAHRALVVLVVATAALAGASCSKPPKTPMGAAMARVGETWTKLHETVKGTGPMAAVGMATEVQGLFRDPAIVGSELYASDADFKRMTDLTIEQLGNLETRIREGNAFEFLADVKAIDDLCKQCHRGYLRSPS